MTLWAIVPVKPLRRGKSRLASVLSVFEREALNQNMLRNTLSILTSLKEIDQVLVVSRDSFVLSIAREFGTRTVLEEGCPKLNLALVRATYIAKAYSANSVMIIPADLPNLLPDDIVIFIHQGGNPPEVVINPDRRLDGTNALLVNPIGLIDYAFGPNSFHKHIQMTEKANARIKVCNLPSLAFDLDYPVDLEYLKQQGQENVLLKYEKKYTLNIGG